MCTEAAHLAAGRCSVRDETRCPGVEVGYWAYHFLQTLESEETLFGRLGEPNGTVMPAAID
ncbi:hypothetical protein N7476_004898 [Penicillium atrosanguineum]|uniref:Uncharacterized protein n=1 Tax=Penicillium atrosanguineum TaxID=1132637 RepID=A0A9W9U542_9EURO|nr:hypothetical protein N7476_004898 [Penicillium atrosanguineum]